MRSVESGRWKATYLGLLMDGYEDSILLAYRGEAVLLLRRCDYKPGKMVALPNDYDDPLGAAFALKTVAEHYWPQPKMNLSFATTAIEWWNLGVPA